MEVRKLTEQEHFESNLDSYVAFHMRMEDPEKVKELGLSAENIKAVMDENRKLLNTQIPAYEQLAGIKVMDREFEKTPKKSIKRYLYTNEEI